MHTKKIASKRSTLLEKDLEVDKIQFQAETRTCVPNSFQFQSAFPRFFCIEYTLSPFLFLCIIDFLLGKELRTFFFGTIWTIYNHLNEFCTFWALRNAAWYVWLPLFCSGIVRMHWVCKGDAVEMQWRGIWDTLEIYWGYTRDTLEILWGYTWDTPGINRRNIAQGIYLGNTRDTPGIHQGYIADTAGIYRGYTGDTLRMH